MDDGHHVEAPVAHRPLNLRGINRLSPLALEPLDKCAMERAHLRQPIAEIAVDDAEHHHAGLKQIRGGGIHARGAGARECE